MGTKWWNETSIVGVRLCSHYGLILSLSITNTKLGIYWHIAMWLIQRRQYRSHVPEYTRDETCILRCDWLKGD